MNNFEDVTETVRYICPNCKLTYVSEWPKKTRTLLNREDDKIVVGVCDACDAELNWEEIN